MMIIEDDSPFHQLPAALNRKQTLFLDGIRYSVEMADLAHSRLQAALLQHTQNVESASEGATGEHYLHTGRHIPRIQTLEKLADALGVSIVDLLPSHKRGADA